MKRDLLYAISCLAFAAIVGGAVYEHLNVVPRWASAPPVSLSMFQGEYGLKPEVFWMAIHPVSLLLLVTSIILHWRSDRRRHIAIVLTTYFAILIITAIYFVPELISIIGTPFSSEVDPELTRRAKTWEALSIVRLIVLIGLALVLFLGLTKSGTSKVGTFLIRTKATRKGVPA